MYECEYEIGMGMNQQTKQRFDRIVWMELEVGRRKEGRTIEDDVQVYATNINTCIC